jgi:hypothetical protein
MTPLEPVDPGPAIGVRALRRMEAAAMLEVATAERTAALRLPPESEIRAHMLGDATRLAVASQQEIGSGLSVVGEAGR